MYMVRFQKIGHFKWHLILINGRVHNDFTQHIENQGLKLQHHCVKASETVIDQLIERFKIQEIKNQDF